MSFAANNSYPPIIVTTSLACAVIIYVPAALASGPLAAGITFAIAYSLTAAAFQMDYWRDLTQRNISCRQKAWWSLQLPFSIIANLTSFFLACDGIDRWGAESAFLPKLSLKIMAGIGCSVEAFFGVLATDYLRAELIYSLYLIHGLFSDKFKHAANQLNAAELANELEYFGHSPKGNPAEWTVEEYEAAEKCLPYSQVYRQKAILLSMLWGSGSAVCFALTAVPFMLAWLSNNVPLLTEDSHKPYFNAVLALLVMTNFYNFIFCSVFGNMGARAFFNKILPSLIDRERCLPAVLALGMVVISTWLLVELALTEDNPVVNIGAALNTIYAGPGALGLATKILASCKKPQVATTLRDTLLSADDSAAYRLEEELGGSAYNALTEADQSLPHR